MITRIYPYRMGSRSARALSEALGVLRIRPRGSRWVPRGGDVVLNWGNPRSLGWPGVVTWLNSPRNVEISSNKLSSLMAMEAQEVSVPPFTQDQEEAQGWLDQDKVVIVRRLLNASSGRGIEIINRGDRLPIAPLYVQYIKKIHEFRVHVFRGEVIDVQQKKKRLDSEANYLIRSHQNGWIFARQEVNPDPKVLEESIKAVSALGLDFGAVDVIWNQHYQTAYVLEVNTAPGLEGTTLGRYVEAIRDV